MFKLKYGIMLQFPSRTCWTSWRIATTGPAMMDSSSHPPLMSHQHLRPLWRWSGVSARETVHRFAVHAGPRTCHAPTYVFVMRKCSAKMMLTHIMTIANQIIMMINVLCCILTIYYLISYNNSICYHTRCSIHLLKREFQVKMIFFLS